MLIKKLIILMILYRKLEICLIINYIKKINNNNTNDDFIENIRDLFSTLDYEPVLIKSGFDNNVLEYMSNGNNS